MWTHTVAYTVWFDQRVGETGRIGSTDWRGWKTDWTIMTMETNLFKWTHNKSLSSWTLLSFFLFLFLSHTLVCTLTQFLCSNVELIELFGWPEGHPSPEFNRSTNSVIIISISWRHQKSKHTRMSDAALQFVCTKSILSSIFLVHARPYLSCNRQFIHSAALNTPYLDDICCSFSLAHTTHTHAHKLALIIRGGSVFSCCCCCFFLQFHPLLLSRNYAICVNGCLQCYVLCAMWMEQISNIYSHRCEFVV